MSHPSGSDWFENLKPGDEVYYVAGGPTAPVKIRVKARTKHHVIDDRGVKWRSPFSFVGQSDRSRSVLRSATNPDDVTEMEYRIAFAWTTYVVHKIDGVLGRAELVHAPSPKDLERIQGVQKHLEEALGLLNENGGKS